MGGKGRALENVQIVFERIQHLHRRLCEIDGDETEK